MNEVKLEIERTTFEPREELTGTAVWMLDQLPRTVEVRLFWFTRGKGTEDAGLVDTVKFDKPKAQDSRSFHFRLPPAPYSFSGNLISLVWALELIIEPRQTPVRQEIIIAPGAQEVRLGSLPQNEGKTKFFRMSKS